MTRDPLDVALSLAREAGWYVFPVNPDPKAGKQPYVRWNDEATTDPEQIATWWSIDFPGAYIGVHTGRSGLVVVDIDEKGCNTKTHPAGCSGSGSLHLEAADIDEAYPEWRNTLNYLTPSGGSHYLYAAPEGVELTIATDHPVDHVDIRSGNGFAVYYGDALTSAPKLAPAPDWALVPRRDAVAPRGDSLPVDAWFARLRAGKPDAEVKAARKAVTADGMSHGDMLDAVTRLVQLGAEGRPGVAEALDRARTTYVQDFPEYDRHWDAALEGSVAHYGAPPVTFEITKAERKQLKSRAEGKAEGPVEPQGSARYLEDSPVAEEIADRIRGHWTTVEGTGLLRYDGKVWVTAPETSLFEATRRLVKKIVAEEVHGAIMREEKQRIPAITTLLQRSRIVSIARLALGIVAEEAEALDSHPDLLNVQNGVVDLRTGELLEHDPAYLFTKIAGAEYLLDVDPVEEELWAKALNAFSTKKVAKWMQVRFGQACTGYTPDDAVMPIIRGGGENGKSTILDGVRYATGNYSVTVSKQILMSQPGAHSTELTDLMGARIAIAEELAEGRNLDVARLKDTVGTDKIRARRMRQDTIEWQATHALFISTNYRPVIAETDHGTWRRLGLVEFPWRFVKPSSELQGSSDRHGDPRLKPAFTTPSAAVLRWLVQGAIEWYAAGKVMPAMPKRVESDTEDWRMEADPILAYVRDHLELAPGYAIPIRQLCDDFNRFLEQRSQHPWSDSLISGRFSGHVSLPSIEKHVVRFGLKNVPSMPTRAFGVKPPVVAMSLLGVKYRDTEGTITNPGDALVTDIASRPTTSPRKAKR